MEKLTNGQLKTIQFLLTEELRRGIDDYWSWMKSNNPDKEKYVSALKEIQKNNSDLLKIISDQIK
jgi:hypothetical protein